MQAEVQITLRDEWGEKKVEVTETKDLCDSPEDLAVAVGWAHQAAAAALGWQGDNAAA